MFQLRTTCIVKCSGWADFLCSFEGSTGCQGYLCSSLLYFELNIYLPGSVLFGTHHLLLHLCRLWAQILLIFLLYIWSKLQDFLERQRLVSLANPQDFFISIFVLFENQKHTRLVIHFASSHVIGACTWDTRFWKGLCRCGYLTCKCYLYHSRFILCLPLHYCCPRLTYFGG